jgi:hypothetical protein
MRGTRRGYRGCGPRDDGRRLARPPRRVGAARFVQTRWLRLRACSQPASWRLVDLQPRGRVPGRNPAEEFALAACRIAAIRGRVRLSKRPRAQVWSGSAYQRLWMALLGCLARDGSPQRRHAVKRTPKARSCCGIAHARRAVSRAVTCDQQHVVVPAFCDTVVCAVSVRRPVPPDPDEATQLGKRGCRLRRAPSAPVRCSARVTALEPRSRKSPAFRRLFGTSSPELSNFTAVEHRSSASVRDSDTGCEECPEHVVGGGRHARDSNSQAGSREEPGGVGVWGCATTENARSHRLLGHRALVGAAGRTQVGSGRATVACGCRSGGRTTSADAELRFRTPARSNRPRQSASWSRVRSPPSMSGSAVLRLARGFWP